MSNNYGIPEDRLKRIRARDKSCVYCYKVMIDHSAGGWRGDWVTIEHLNIIPPWNNADTVEMCCWSCNSSRGNKKLLDWFKTSYCTEKNISSKSVAEPVKEYIIRFMRSKVNCYSSKSGR